MENQEDFGKGAIKDIFDKRDVQYHKIAMGLRPFDWDTGYDVENELKKLLKDDSFRIKSKDQNGSGSCGGQAWSYYGAVLEAFSTGTYEERSAKFIYAQTFVKPAGSAGRTNCELVISQGWATEQSCASYENGNPPSEQFMQQVADITPNARIDARRAKALLYANVASNIDLIAQAIENNNGMVIGITGSQNGTWRSVYPKPPVAGQDLWNHWLYVGKAKLINGKKFIAVKNSWGDATGDLGWQWIGEDYFKSTPVIGIPIWSGWTMVFKPYDESFHYNFTKTLKIGDNNEDVRALQKALTQEGMFKGKNDGVFGKITFASVEIFQARYGLVVDGVVGPKTKELLNKFYK